MKSRALVAVTLLITLAGCRTWQPAPQAFEQIILHQRPDQIRVRLFDGTHRVIHQPRIEGDTLSGFSPNGPTGAVHTRSVEVLDPVSVALVDVASVETRQVDVTRTARVAPVVVGGLFVVVLLLFGDWCLDADCLGGS